jgi:ABC-2 type transport system ATP-binding protein
MSILVKNVTKIYGQQRALDEVSFSTAPRTITGFLGPNGAGKSTMMKILTSFLPPTSGEASVAGRDVQKEGVELRRMIGYLPEHNPLYLDMYVKEFLHFCAGIYGIASPAKRVAEMVAITGLTGEQHKKIGALSKGYRQRVGLAQAMIHDPAVLIMDEPTTGLDPNQLDEIRKLIRELGREKTVLLSTHIMQEVEAVCDRVIIINKGKIVADDETSKLKSGLSAQILEVEFDKPVTAGQLQRIEGVGTVKLVGGNTWRLHCNTEKDLRREVFDFAISQGLAVLTLNRTGHKLEDIFRELTGSPRAS